MFFRDFKTRFSLERKVIFLNRTEWREFAITNRGRTQESGSLTCDTAPQADEAPSITFDHTLDEQYIIDIPSIGFYSEPLDVKVYSGPAEFSPYPTYKETRDEFVASSDDNKAEPFINIFL